MNFQVKKNKDIFFLFSSDIPQLCPQLLHDNMSPEDP